MKIIKRISVFLIMFVLTFLLSFQFGCNDDGYVVEGGVKYALNQDKSAYAVVELTNSNLNIVEISNEINGLPVKEIGSGAFINGANLTSVYISANINYIANGTFEECGKLSFIKVSENNLRYSSKTGILYNKDFTEIVYVPMLVAGDIIIPNTVSAINSLAFFNRTTLKTVCFEENSPLEVIGASAFEGCKNLENFIVPKSLKGIEVRAFAGCVSLKNIDLYNAENLTEIGARAFTECKKLNNVVLPYNLSVINEGVFLGCENLSGITFPTVDFEIKSKAFWRCGFERIIINDNVLSIEGGAFSLNYNLLEFVVDDNNSAYKDIDGNLYSKDGKTFICYALKKSIGQNASEDFTISSDVVKILEYAFFDDDGKMILSNINVEGASGWCFNGQNAQYLISDSRLAAGALRYSHSNGIWTR